MAAPLAAILRELVAANVDFVVVGGIAVNAHGFTRNTYDLDIIVRFDAPNVSALVNCLKARGFSPRMPVNPEDLSRTEVRADWQSRNIVTLCFIEGHAPFNVVDVFIDHPINYEQLSADAVRSVYADVSIKIGSISHLIKLKEMAMRPKDLQDLKFLYEALDQEKKGCDERTTSC